MSAGRMMRRSATRTLERMYDEHIMYIYQKGAYTNYVVEDTGVPHKGYPLPYITYDEKQPFHECKKRYCNRKGYRCIHNTVIITRKYLHRYNHETHKVTIMNAEGFHVSKPHRTHMMDWCRGEHH